ncbi:DNA-binding transcriptional regulator, AcrR family [Amycolatopsis sacchari]|uniref:DNA-binding transcriptional regulator, AcrR family n=1 Tax=Amycolatopsis sacchari TaxID=115433 RepID=A0A1I3R8R4_9PSEU|nr:TetR/AcrR family transcriptional regulator [Amycolatopsis sacchari]SFJ41791.1 DNA-binding transcriptional regulator, AcrR family [Amycolatopsis sacchari]
MARPRKFDERAVLTAVRDRFWRRGYASTSIQDLTDATGLGTQSLYGAFGSKRALFLRILDEYCARQAAGLEAALDEDPSPWHGLASAVVFEDGGRMELPPQGCLMANSAAALSAQDEGVRARACRSYSGTLELFAGRIREAQESGEIDDDLDPEATARALIAVMQGIEFLHKAGIGEEEFQRAKTAALEMIERAVGR